MPSDAYLSTVIDQVRNWDADRPRSLQREPGWSDMAGCRSYLGFELAQEWPSDEEDNWRAIVGTALHDWLTAVRSAAMAAEFPDEDVDFSVPVSYGGVPGHLDEVNYTRGEVVDYKTTRLASVRVWGDPDVLEEKFIQVQGYAAGLLGDLAKPIKAGTSELTVRMLVIPVDGTFDDWRVYERPFDRQVADDALARYAYVKEAVAAGDPLPKDKPWFFCEKFCRHFGNCRGGTQPSREFEEITDPELAAAVEAYGLANEQSAASEQAKKELVPLIKGLRGSARGWRISLSKPGAGKMVPDETAIERAFAQAGLEVPLRKQALQAPKLHVIREKRPSP